MALSCLSRLIWEQIMSCLPPVHFYEARCIIGEDLIDQTLELKSEIISVLELANNNDSFLPTSLDSSNCPTDVEYFTFLYLNSIEKSKHNNPDQTFDGLKEESELEYYTRKIRNAILAEISHLKTYLQNIQNSLLENFSTLNHEQENISQTLQADSVSSKPKPVHNNSVTNQKLSCGLEFLLSQNSINGLLSNSNVPCSSVSLSNRSSSDTSSSSSLSSKSKRKSIHDSLSLHQNLNNCRQMQMLSLENNKAITNSNNVLRKSITTYKLSTLETKQLQSDTNQKFDEQIHLPDISNSLTSNSFKQLKQKSYLINKSQLINQNVLYKSDSTQLCNIKQIYSNDNRYNSAQKFRQMILKARQDSGNY
ncbi:unnamed protein product [Schistosoma intercalatum]|nr:unnamed protein product [Schistosoma intercalatum]